jgi:hypothetical protein
MNTIHRTGEISGFRSEIVTVDGIRVSLLARRRCRGQPVILWHGFLSTGYA